MACNRAKQPAGLPAAPATTLVVRPLPLGKLAHVAEQQSKHAGHHARPSRASATAPLYVEADMCKTGTGGGSCAGAETEPDCRRSSHERAQDQAGRLRLVNYSW